MDCFVTGGSGFIGSNLVHELVARGHRVRVLLRPDSVCRCLEDVPYEPVVGNLLDLPGLVKVMRGCQWCFHVAASYHLWLPDYCPMYETNVEGTRTVLRAAIETDCSRIVYTSTVGCIGLLPANGSAAPPADETLPASESMMANDYKRSKWRAEQVALGLAGEGAPIIVVNPSAPAGPRDAKPTPTGKFILDFLNREMPGYIHTGLNWVHVRDVAIGHILAAERGRIGQRYILGNTEGNWTMEEVLRTLSELTGVRAPRFRIPYLAALAAAHVDESVASITGRPPKAVLAGVRMARNTMFYSSAKAVRELGLPQTSPRRALADSVQWFRQNGYVRGSN